METISPYTYNEYRVEIGKVYAIRPAANGLFGFSTAGMPSSPLRAGEQLIVAPEERLYVHGSPGDQFTFTEAKGRIVPSDPAVALSGRNLSLGDLALTGTLDVYGMVMLNNTSISAPNATTSLTGVATAANMFSFYCTLWGQAAPVRDISNVSNAADTQVCTALESGVTPFNISGSVGSVFVSNSACAVGVKGFLIESADGFHNVKHATISAMTTPLTLTLGATVYSKPTASPLNAPLVLRQNMFGVYFNGTETQSPQVATGAWLNLWFRKVTAGTLYIYVGNTNAI